MLVWERISEEKIIRNTKKSWPGVLCVSKPSPATAGPGQVPAAPRLSSAGLCQTRPTLWGNATGVMPEQYERERDEVSFLWYQLFLLFDPLFIHHLKWLIMSKEVNGLCLSITPSSEYIFIWCEHWKTTYMIMPSCKCTEISLFNANSHFWHYANINNSKILNI